MRREIAAVLNVHSSLAHHPKLVEQLRKSAREDSIDHDFYGLSPVFEDNLVNRPKD
ncbi:hypothetical protein M1403_00735 [Patescibacteria group bacterium]|nr:hypothetical protein [Patescibacteria group bacterium]